MVVNKKIKLGLSFRLYLQSSLRIQITDISDILQSVEPNIKLYTDPDGFIMDTGYVCTFNRHCFSIPTFVNYDDYNDSDLYAYFNFLTDKDRYNSLKRLYRYMQELSQSRVFQYDNTGYVDVRDNKWILY